jgi:AraC-like DNA-binding protein
MNFQNIIPDKSVSLFVKSIWVFEETNEEQKTILPFFADGFPGLIYYEAAKGMTVFPLEKIMPSLFIYGQTISPIEVVFEGSYKMIVFQLYPFILKRFFNINPKTINDNCYDLQQLKDREIRATNYHLPLSNTTERRIELITSFLSSVFEAKKQTLDFKLKQALQLTMDKKGQLSIKDLCKEIKMKERTLERRFTSETGVSPKQFAKIIQFQSSLEQLTVKDFNKLTDIVYQNGFADQSHFIKVFKAFTGKTPKIFSKK